MVGSKRSGILTKEQKTKTEQLKGTIEKYLNGDVAIPDEWKTLVRNGVTIALLDGMRLPDEEVMNELSRWLWSKGWKKVEFRRSHIYGPWVELS